MNRWQEIKGEMADSPEGVVSVALWILLAAYLLSACATPAPVVTTPAECRGYRLVVQPDGTHKSVCARMATPPAKAVVPLSDTIVPRREGAP